MDADFYKIFRDPVHGNICVENWVCENFVDTDVFQRLRFVEQSSMRLLYPGARHDRFIHSLGVFFIAKKIFSIIKSQFKIAGLTERQQTRLYRTFIIAALLHDCAHSPFSHTGEELAKAYCNQEIERLLKSEVGAGAFKKDFYKRDKESYHTHEMASAYVGCHVYSKELKKCSVDREQFARMIIGQKNKGERLSLMRRAYNCLIPLINGFVVDADRLDYLLRDTWATGVCNSSVDIDRLLSGLSVDVKKGRICFRHKALSSLVSAVEARDYIYTWILPHHKVAYASTLLIMALQALVVELSRRSKEFGRKKLSELEVGQILFSPERLLVGKEKCVCDEVISLPTDGDFIYLMKKYIPDNTYVRAYLSRKKEFISLWKTYAEFIDIFNVESYKRGVLLEKPFWDMFDSKVAIYCKNEKDIICTKTSRVKQTSGDLLAVDIVGPDWTSRSQKCRQLDPSNLFGEKPGTKYYMYAFIRRSSRGKSQAVVRSLQKIFCDCVDWWRHQ